MRFVLKKLQNLIIQHKENGIQEKTTNMIFNRTGITKNNCESSTQSQKTL